MTISQIIQWLETIAPGALQESYDNTGLLTGDSGWHCTGVITTLDATEEVVVEAIENKCNLIVAHHPVIFCGMKNINGKNYVEKTVIRAIKNDIAIYAIHTNLDNVLHGVNGKIAEKLGLSDLQILVPKTGLLKKLVTYAPTASAANVRMAIFKAGGGHIGNYSECSFSTPGQGTFKAGDGSSPYVGVTGEQHSEEEVKIEVVFPVWLQKAVVTEMIAAHPYEEVAYDIIALENKHNGVGSGIIGELGSALDEKQFLQKVKELFNTGTIRHTQLTGRLIKKVAICGGAGSFLIGAAIASGADCFISSDIKYHEFFEADGKLVLADIGHYESEQFTIDLLFDILRKKFPNFAIQKTGVKTNPVQYFK